MQQTLQTENARHYYLLLHLSIVEVTLIYFESMHITCSSHYFQVSIIISKQQKTFLLVNNKFGYKHGYVKKQWN